MKTTERLDRIEKRLGINDPYADIAGCLDTVAFDEYLLLLNKLKQPSPPFWAWFCSPFIQGDMELFRVIAHDPCCNEYTFDSQSNAKMCGGFIRLATPHEIKVHLIGWAEKVTEKAGLFVPKEIGLNNYGIMFDSDQHVLSWDTPFHTWSVYSWCSPRDKYDSDNTGTNYRITDQKPERGDLIYRGGSLTALDAYGFYLGDKECVLVYGRGVLYGASGQEKKIIKV